MSTPEINQPLPPFSLPAVAKSGDGFAECTLDNAALAGQTFVLFFYPKDATSGCTIEVCSFRELHGEFEKLGVKLVGVSRDRLSAHRRFIENQSLPYPLASDDGAKLIAEWGLLSQGTMYGKPVTRVARTTFVVDGSGTVRRVFEKVTPAGHAQEVLEFVKSL